MAFQKNNYYLLEEDSQSLALIENLRQMLESNEAENIELALQLMQGGGLPPSLVTCLSMVLYWSSFPYIRKPGKALLKKFNPKAYKAMGKHWRNNYWTEEQVSRFLKELLLAYPFNARELALISIRMSGRGARFAFENAVAPNALILGMLVDDNHLSLQDMGLSSLPEEIGHFTRLRSLDIRGNCFSTLPESIASLQQLEHLNNEGTPLRFATWRRLTKQLPGLLAQRRMERGNREYSYKRYEKALRHFLQACEASPLLAEAWNMAGYCLAILNRHREAIVYFKKCLELEPENIFAWANLAEACCSDKAYDQALQTAEHGIDLAGKLTGYSLTALANLWFIKGLAHFWRQEYREGLLANDVSLQYSVYAGAWYNKACCSAKLNDKTAMLQYLEKSIVLDDHYLEMALLDEDRDFDAFYEDKDFKQLLAKYHSN